MLALAALLLPARGAARELTLTLDDAIAMARVQSVDAAVALDELKTAYWQWRRDIDADLSAIGCMN